MMLKKVLDFSSTVLNLKKKNQKTASNKSWNNTESSWVNWNENTM